MNFVEVSTDAMEDGAQGIDADRFRQHVVHAHCQTILAALAVGVRSKRHNGRLEAALLLERVDDGGRLDAVHHGHLNVHEHHVIAIRLERLHRLLAIVCHVHLRNRQCNSTTISKQ